MPKLCTFLYFILSCSVLNFAGAQVQPHTQPTWAEPVASEVLSNFYEIGDELYRSAQPSAQAMRELDARGFKSVLNLSFISDDTDEAAGTDLALFHTRMDPYHVREASIVYALSVMRRAERPLVVHCTRGADRTGLIIALYRVLYQGWSKEEALDEMIEGPFDFYWFIFGNIVSYIKEVNVEGLRAQVEAYRF